MEKSAMVRARIEPKLKIEVEAILDTLGISTTDAIRMFFYLVKEHRGFPYELKVPNAKTMQAFKESETKIGNKKHKSFEEMMKLLNR